VINGNTSDTLTVQTNFASDVPQDQWIQFNPGDAYEIHKVNHSLDSAGAGKGDLIRIVGGVPINQVTGLEHSNPHQMQENSYSWNNVVQRTGQVLGLAGQYCIIEGRDFFNLGAGKPADAIPDEVKNFYTAANNGVAYVSEYEYPHPLRSGVVPATPTPSPSPSPTDSPAPTPTETPTETPTPSVTPSETPTPTATPTATETPTPTATPDEAPIAPSGLSAIGISKNQIDLRWTNNDPRADAIYIERHYGVGEFFIVNIVSASTTRLSDFQLLHGTTYWYRVRIHTPVGWSAYSNTASGTTHH
jgi:hypothetical protein